TGVAASSTSLRYQAVGPGGWAAYWARRVVLPLPAGPVTRVRRWPDRGDMARSRRSRRSARAWGGRTRGRGRGRLRLPPAAVACCREVAGVVVVWWSLVAPGSIRPRDRRPGSHLRRDAPVPPSLSCRGVVLRRGVLGTTSGGHPTPPGGDRGRGRWSFPRGDACVLEPVLDHIDPGGGPPCSPPSHLDGGCP